MAPTENRVTFDVGQLRRPKDETASEPFVVHLPALPETDAHPAFEERDVVFSDPSELSWQELLEIAHPVSFIRYCVSEADRNYLRDYPLQGWQFNKLMESFQRHYKLERRPDGGFARR